MVFLWYALRMIGLTLTRPTFPNVEQRVKPNFPAKDAASPLPEVRRLKIERIKAVKVAMRFAVICNKAIENGNWEKLRPIQIALNLNEGFGDFSNDMHHPQSAMKSIQHLYPILEVLARSMQITSSTQWVAAMPNA